MKHVLVIVLCAIVTCLGCDNGDKGVEDDAIIGSGNMITVEEFFTNFIRIDISNAFEATITRADSYSVVVRVDDNIDEFLRIVTEEDLLRISLDSGHTYKDVTLEADITLPDLEALSLSGATSATLTGFQCDHDADLVLTGASVTTGTLDIGSGDLDILLSGASRITLDGSGHNLDVNASGASVVELGGFQCHDGDVILSGASLATIRVSGELDATVSGVSTLYYFGNPTLGTIIVTGESTIQSLGP